MEQIKWTLTRSKSSEGDVIAISFLQKKKINLAKIDTRIGGQLSSALIELFLFRVHALSVEL